MITRIDRALVRKTDVLFPRLRKWMILICAVGQLFASHVRAQSRFLVRRVSVALDVGNWQPHSLNHEPRFTTFGAAGATPYIGLAVAAPLAGGTAIRLSMGYWSLQDLEEVDFIHSLVLHPICVSFKTWLVPDYRLSPYVMYGGGLWWGVENETEPFGSKLHKARAGWGASLGAGFDLVVTRRVGLGLAFQYHFVRFREPLGGVEDFSGPRITVSFFVLL